MSTSRTAVVLGGRYRLEDWIATGGMGQVWRAADLVLHRRVAVKLLRAEYAQHPETLARFRAEARHAGSLSHPCIAQIYDYGEAERAHPPFLVMELVDGPPLAQLLAAGPLDPARVMDVIAQAAEGLQAAHTAGLVHRDVKPGNLLLAPGDRVKITDFGIAHAAGSAPITRTGMVVGPRRTWRRSGWRAHPRHRPAICTRWASSPMSAWRERRRSTGPRWRSRSATSCAGCRRSRRRYPRKRPRWSPS
jgi:serine/threonine protein kinase